MEPPSDVSAGTPAGPADPPGTGTSLIWLVGFIGAITAALHLFSALYPSWANWGTHHLAFLPVWVQWTVPLLMAAALLPAVQMRLGAGIERPRLFSGAAALVLLALAFWLVRERTFFLGDGYLNLRGIGEIDAVENLHFQFEKEPLSGLMVWRIFQVLSGWNVAGAALLAYQIVSILSGVVGAAAMLLLAHTLATRALDRTLMFLVLLASGGTQLFCGYVENYAPSYAMLLLYGATAVAYLREQTPVVLPAALFAVLLATQLGMAVLAPSLAYLIWTEGARRRRVASAAIAVATAVGLFALLLWFCGYSWDLLRQIAGRGGDHLLGLLQPAGDRQPYAFFSAEHFVEFGNLQFLLNPFALVIFLRLFSLRKTRWAASGTVWRFWMLSAPCTLAASLLLHWDLGMSRDWDVLSVFSLAVIPASLAGLVCAVPEDRQRSRIMLVMGAVMLLHTLPWIAVNAGETASVARIKILPQRKVWGTTAWKSVLEELAIYFRDHEEPGKAAACYAEYLSVDSTNARIWANYASSSSQAGARPEEVFGYEQAVRYGSTWYPVYTNLGSAYAQRDRVDDAIALYEHSLALEPVQPPVHNAIGALLLEHRHAYADALRHLRLSMAMDSAYAPAYLNAGECAARLHDTSAARSYFGKFLELAPDDPRSGEARARLRELR
jgi:hypothetical protein